MAVVLTGDTRSRRLIKRLKERGWGRLSVTAKPSPYPGEPWGIDNGAYSAFLKGEELDMKRFELRCEQATEIGGCYMAVLPDRVAAGLESLDYSLEQLDKLPPLPWYLAVQDGMESQPGMNRVWNTLEDERISGIFIGGTSPFKVRTINLWRIICDKTGKKLHYGRAGTPYKVQHALRSEVDSLDSAFPLWTRERWEIFEKAVDGELPQLTFEEWCSDFYQDDLRTPRRLEGEP